MRIGDLTVGERGRVLGLGKGERAYRQRLLAMGLTPGTEFTVTRLAPLGDPVEISVRGYAMSLRKDEAGMLSIEKLAT
ncbi:MAG: ferrous iron transport protein A [Rhodospirillales bacterium]|nr:ferrous iron transport protein A [Rhodospirillales bacterium]